MLIIIKIIITTLHRSQTTTEPHEVMPKRLDEPNRTNNVLLRYLWLDHVMVLTAIVCFLTLLYPGSRSFLVNADQNNCRRRNTECAQSHNLGQPCSNGFPRLPSFRRRIDVNSRSLYSTWTNKHSNFSLQAFFSQTLLLCSKLSTPSFFLMSIFHCFRLGYLI